MLTTIGGIVLGVSAIVSLVCMIIVLVKMFKAGEVLMGVLGILICNLIPYVWGWMKAKEHDLKKVMVAWTVAIIFSFVGVALFVPGMYQLQQNEGLEIEGFENPPVQDAAGGVQ